MNVRDLKETFVVRFSFGEWHNVNRLSERGTRSRGLRNGMKASWAIMYIQRAKLMCYLRVVAVNPDNVDT